MPISYYCAWSNSVLLPGSPWRVFEIIYTFEEPAAGMSAYYITCVGVKQSPWRLASGHLMQC
jgi:hypothetical protein